ncbi:hypothetical protein ACFV1W_11435 [Kitasatospora sp. NPDC059648]|uniref:hypothetical protein n=1 Tax=Kitasatospora sp. NPDC059648 TaxID=3346894 RepID=UPI0036784B0C
MERLHGLALAGGLVPSNAFRDEQSPPYRAFAEWLRGPDLQLAVETAVFRTDDPTQLEQLFTVHDILAP